jgi:hypothetical protein
MPNVPMHLQNRAGRRAKRTRTKDRQRPEPRAQRKPAPVSDQPPAVVPAAVFLVPSIEGWTARVLGPIEKVFQGPSVRSVLGAVTEKLASDVYDGFELRQRAKRICAPSNLELEPGKFYTSRAGDKWCCYDLDETRGTALHARCISVQHGSLKMAYYYRDGRHDVRGEDGWTLVAEVQP